MMNPSLAVAIAIVALTLVAYVVIGRRITATTVSEFLTGSGRMDQRSYFAMVCGSSISLGAAILAFLGLGYALPWVAVLATGTWLIGFLWHYRVVTSTLARKENRDLTIHGLIASSGGSNSARMLAAGASIVGFAGAYGIEMMAITKLTAPLLPTSPLANAGILGALIVSLYLYMSRGGILAVAKTDKWQLILFSVAILFSAWFILQRVVTPKFSLADDLRITRDSFPLLLCIALVVLNIPWQLVDMSQWQRSYSCADNQTIKRGLVASAIGIGVSWLLLISLGLVLREVPLVNNDPVATFVAQFSNDPIAYAIFLVAAVAALLSTADAYVIAAVQSVYRDIYQGSPAINDQGAELSRLRKLTSYFIVFPPFFAFAASLVIPEILNLFFLVFAAQLALTPAVVLMTKNQGTLNRGGLLLSLSLGLICALGFFLHALFTGDSSNFFVSPIATLATSALAYWLGTLFPYSARRPVAFDLKKIQKEADR